MLDKGNEFSSCHDEYNLGDRLIVKCFGPIYGLPGFYIDRFSGILYLVGVGLLAFR